MKKIYALWLYLVTLIAVCIAVFQSMSEEDRVILDASYRSASVAASIEESVTPAYLAKRYERVAKTVEKLRAQGQLRALAVCPFFAAGHTGYPGLFSGGAVGFPKTEGWEEICRSPAVEKVLARSPRAPLDHSWIVNDSDIKSQYFAHRIDTGTDAHAQSLVLVLAQDLSGLKMLWIRNFLRTFLMSWTLGIALLLIAATQMRGWIKSHVRIFHKTLRSLIAGKKPHALPLASDQIPSDLQPISRDLDKLAAKIFALTKPQNEKKKEFSWLSALKESMGDRNLVVIANREPYIHNKVEDRIEIIRPASGLVTALEPILRLCGGQWIAHGSGSADAETADENGEVAVPPGKPRYKLKRVWLSKEEEAGYYYGFSNEGLWPLCHLAHTRPTFRLTDWEIYQSVNQKFCDAIPESALEDKSLILVQDYHFGMLPRMIKQRAANGKTKTNPKVGVFWHIPWPNPEAFGICPWNEDILRGMLGADVIGFHTQYHCNNFLEACNRYLEARIDYERFSVTMENHETIVRAFPIGIDTSPVRVLSDPEIAELKTRYGIKAKYVAVGVDRLDYTKGIVERVEAVGRFLEKYPEYVGQFSLVQMGSPSRSSIPAYQLFTETLNATVARINEKFGDPANGYLPIIFLSSHHEWDEIQYFYQLGDICMVTSLHDGMNLVAKEYVWCQRPERGSLILSKFTGASRELSEAFIVNPYSVEEMADALAGAIRLPAEERFRRMYLMREKVQAHNAYHWASDLIQALMQCDDRRQGPPSELGPGLMTATAKPLGSRRVLSLF